MNKKYCRCCGHKIPRQYRKPNGSIRKTKPGRRFCYRCDPIKIHGDQNTRENHNHIEHKQERRRRKKILVEMLGGKCSKCGYDKSLAALSFHHLDPSKKCFDISHNGSLMRDWDELVTEVKKCVVLCLNCHSEIEEVKNSHENR